MRFLAGYVLGFSFGISATMISFRFSLLAINIQHTFTFFVVIHVCFHFFGLLLERRVTFFEEVPLS